MNKELSKLIVIILTLLGVLVLSIVQSISFGILDISYGEILDIVVHRLLGISTLQVDSVKSDVIFDLRLPRIIMAVICGGSLSLGGVVMQAVVRNPMADPYVLGVSSGAALGATASILLGAFSFGGMYAISIGAFVGAVTVTFVAFGITLGLGGQGTTKLILAGTALNAICGACTSMITYTAKDLEGIRDAGFWLMGSMARISWEVMMFPLIAFLLVAIFFMFQFRTLDASLLGEEMATILGVKLKEKRRLYLVLVSALVSVVVASVGVIGFVGLVVPHIVRMVCGNNHLKLVPVATICGSIYMVWCDVFARVLLPNAEIPIGVLTSLVGGPFFLYLMMKKSYGYGDE